MGRNKDGTDISVYINARFINWLKNQVLLKRGWLLNK